MPWGVVQTQPWLETTLSAINDHAPPSPKIPRWFLRVQHKTLDPISLLGSYLRDEIPHDSGRPDLVLNNGKFVSGKERRSSGFVPHYTINCLSPTMVIYTSPITSLETVSGINLSKLISGSSSMSIFPIILGHHLSPESQGAPRE